MIDPKKYPVTAVTLATADADEDATYKITRNYKDHPDKRKVMKRGLTLKEAQEWCGDPETSSSECEEPENIKHTEQYGPWFDGYDRE